MKRWLALGMGLLVVALALPEPAEGQTRSKYRRRHLREREIGALAPNWFLAGSNAKEYRVGSDRTITYAGEPSGFIQSSGLNFHGVGTLATRLPADEFQGERVRFSAMVKAHEVQNWAGLWIGVETPDHPFKPSSTSDAWLQVATHDNRLMGSVDWRRVALEIDVPADASELLLGLVLAGRGTAFLSHADIEVVVPTEPPKAPSLQLAPVD